MSDGQSSSVAATDGPGSTVVGTGGAVVVVVVVVVVFVGPVVVVGSATAVVVVGDDVVVSAAVVGAAVEAVVSGSEVAGVVGALVLVLVTWVEAEVSAVSLPHAAKRRSPTAAGTTLVTMRRVVWVELLGAVMGIVDMDSSGWSSGRVDQRTMASGRPWARRDSGRQPIPVVRHDLCCSGLGSRGETLHHRTGALGESGARTAVSVAHHEVVAFEHLVASAQGGRQELQHDGPLRSSRRIRSEREARSIMT